MGLHRNITAFSAGRIMITNIEGNPLNIQIAITSDIIIDKIEGNIPISELINILQKIEPELKNFNSA